MLATTHSDVIERARNATDTTSVNHRWCAEGSVALPDGTRLPSKPPLSKTADKDGASATDESENVLCSCG
ncbi:hypothetical protein QTH87_22990 [Variovorax sp. J22P168]|uniref:hypothetical protein n=1 Tax=Variovorax jilinensis TaxID=3053513 RepID=UPI002577B18B|nr:hypothetical protein [Variovorax sp. J22P168]MDM0015327.1 hypothetical protein [Variovorax sp. J22P168]